MTDKQKSAESTLATDMKFDGSTDEERGAHTANLDEGAMWPTAFALVE